MKNKDEGEGKGRVNREGAGLVDFPPLKRGGGGERGGLIEDLRYVTFLSQHTITISSLRTRLKQKKKNKKQRRDQWKRDFKMPQFCGLLLVAIAFD